MPHLFKSAVIAVVAVLALSACTPERPTFTDASLADLLRSIDTGVEELVPLDPEYLDTRVDELEALIASLRERDVEPVACADATIASVEALARELPIAVSRTDISVQLLAFPTDAEAKAAVEAQREAIDACRSYTVTAVQDGEKVATEVTSVDGGVSAASVPNGISTIANTLINGEPASVLTTWGSVGNIVIQVTDPYAADESRVAMNSTILEDVGVAVAEAVEG